jgi:hypothetical protein
MDGTLGVVVWNVFAGAVSSAGSDENVADGVVGVTDENCPSIADRLESAVAGSIEGVEGTAGAMSGRLDLSTLSTLAGARDATCVSEGATE